MAGNADGATPLFIAAAKNSAAALKLLLTAKADPSRSNRNGDTPLTIAAYAGSLEATRMLLNGGANVNAVGYQGAETALDTAHAMRAAAKTSEDVERTDEVIKALVKAGA